MFEECSCEYGDGEYAEVSIYRERAGRKDWTCCECDEVIPRGVVHHYLKSLYDGAWTEDRWCDRCQRIRKDAAPCAPVGGLWEELAECYGEDVA